VLAEVSTQTSVIFMISITAIAATCEVSLMIAML